MPVSCMRNNPRGKRFAAGPICHASPGDCDRSPHIQLLPSSESGAWNTACQLNHFSLLANPRAHPLPDHHWICLPEIQRPTIILRLTFLIAPVALSPLLIRAIRRSASFLRSLCPPAMNSSLLSLSCAPEEQQCSTINTRCNYSTKTAFIKERKS